MKVLIIEDNFEFAELLKYFLDEQGIDSIIATDFTVIVDHIHACDAVISDYNTKPICNFKDIDDICYLLKKKLLVLTGELSQVYPNQIFKMDMPTVDFKKAILGQ